MISVAPLPLVWLAIMEYLAIPIACYITYEMISVCRDVITQEQYFKRLFFSGIFYLSFGLGLCLGFILPPFL